MYPILPFYRKSFIESLQLLCFHHNSSYLLHVLVVSLHSFAHFFLVLFIWILILNLISFANSIEIDHVLTLFTKRYIEAYLTEITYFYVFLSWDYFVVEVTWSLEKTQRIVSFELILINFIHEHFLLL